MQTIFPGRVTGGRSSSPSTGTPSSPSTGSMSSISPPSRIASTVLSVARAPREASPQMSYTQPSRRSAARACPFAWKLTSRIGGPPYAQAPGVPVRSDSSAYPHRMAKDLPTGRVRRAAKVGRLAGGQAARGYATKAANLTRDEEARHAAAARRQMEAAEQIFDVLGQMKGAAMKVGQVASFIDTGAFPPEFQERIQAKLAELRDAAPRVSFDRMRKVIEDDLGERLDDVFAEFDEDAVAAASIGQVYRARLHDGREVAVKVQYPGVEPGRARRPPEPGADHARGEADRARHGREGDDGRDPRAAHRRARLRARGAAAPRLRAELARPPVHLRAGGRHRPLHRARARERVGRGDRLRGGEGAGPRHARPLRRDHLPLLLRVAVPERALLGRPAPRQLPADAGRPRGVHRLRDDEARGARGHRGGGGRAAGRDGRRRGGAAPPARRDGLLRPGRRGRDPRGRVRPLPRRDRLVHRGPRGDRGPRARGPDADRLRRPALAPLAAHAPRDDAAPGDARPPDGGAHARACWASSRRPRTGTGSPASGCSATRPRPSWARSKSRSTPARRRDQGVTEGSGHAACRPGHGTPDRGARRHRHGRT